MKNKKNKNRLFILFIVNILICVCTSMLLKTYISSFILFFVNSALSFSIISNLDRDYILKNWKKGKAKVIEIYELCKDNDVYYDIYWEILNENNYIIKKKSYIKQKKNKTIPIYYSIKDDDFIEEKEVKIKISTTFWIVFTLITYLLIFLKYLFVDIALNNTTLKENFASIIILFITSIVFGFLGSFMFYVFLSRKFGKLKQREVIGIVSKCVKKEFEPEDDMEMEFGYIVTYDVFDEKTMKTRKLKGEEIKSEPIEIGSKRILYLDGENQLSEFKYSGKSNLIFSLICFVAVVIMLWFLYQMIFLGVVL